MIRGKLSLSLLCVCVSVSLTSTSLASFTAINDPFFGELSHLEILNGLNGYGGGFTQNGVNFSSASVTVTRVHDFGKLNPINLLGGEPDLFNDRWWIDGVSTISLQAKYSFFEQAFGYRYDDGGGEVLYTTPWHATGFLDPGDFAPVPIEFDLGRTWQWGFARHRFFGGWDVRFSADELDQFITYRVDGLNNGADTTWLLFCEDLVTQPCVGDFNDLVVEVKAYNSIAPPIFIPAPGALLLAALGSLLVTASRRFKH